MIGKELQLGFWVFHTETDIKFCWSPPGKSPRYLRSSGVNSIRGLVSHGEARSGLVSPGGVPRRGIEDNFFNPPSLWESVNLPTRLGLPRRALATCVKVGRAVAAEIGIQQVIFLDPYLFGRKHPARAPQGEVRQSTPFPFSNLCRWTSHLGVTGDGLHPVGRGPVRRGEVWRGPVGGPL
jgi:hypothetical protein